MHIKIVIRLFALGFLFIGIILSTFYIKSDEFKGKINILLGIGPSASKSYVWCPDHTIDFEWLDSNLKIKFDQLSLNQNIEKFCQLTLEPIVGVDITNLEFKKILKVQSAEAKFSYLEWNPKNKVFKVNNLPFSSTYLWRVLVDEPQ